MRAPGATWAGIAYWKLPIVTVPPVSGGFDVATTGLGWCVGLGLALAVVGAAVVGATVFGGGVLVCGAAVVVRAAGVVGGTVVRVAVVGVGVVFVGDGTTDSVIVGFAFVVFGLGLGAAVVVGASVVGGVMVIVGDVEGVEDVKGREDVAADDAEASGEGLTEPPD